MQQNALNSLAAIDGIVAENNGKRERLIAELIEEKLLLKEVYNSLEQCCQTGRPQYN